MALLALLAYAPSIAYGFVYDDGLQILGNPWVWRRSDFLNLLTRPVWGFVSGGPGNFYRPVQMGLYGVVAQAFGRRPAAFHLASILLHALASAAVLVLMRRIVPGTTALVAALLFAVHPIHSEAVAWVSASPELELGLGVALSLAAWIAAWGPAPPPEGASVAPARVGGQSIPPSPAWIAVAAAAALWASLSKETAVVLPVLALLAPRRRAPGARRVAAGFALAYALPAALALGARAAAIGALAPVAARAGMTPGRAIGTALALLPRYLALAFAPWRPVPDRVVDPAAGPLDPMALAGAAVLVAAAAAWLWARRRRPAAAFGLALLVLPILPALNVTYLAGSLMCDRYLYVPTMGACLLLALGAAAIGRRPALRPALALVLCAVVAAGWAGGAAAASMWRDSGSLGRSGVALAPRSVLMRLELVHALDGRGRTAEALRVAEEAQRIDPGSGLVRAAIAGLRSRAADGGATTPEGNAAAIAILEAAVAADPAQAHLWVLLSADDLRAGRPDDAARAAGRALAIEPSNEAAILNLGTALGQMGDAAGQEREARRLLSFDDESADGWLNLGAARLAQGDLDAARQALERSDRLDPHRARVALYLSVVAARRGERDEALRQAERAGALDPGDAEAWSHLGAMRAASGDRDGARRAWEKALEIDPRQAQARANLERLATEPRP